MKLKKLMKDLKFIFCGTPDLAVKNLEMLKVNGYIPSLIITAPDKPVGRGMRIIPPAVKTWAIQNKIPYLQPQKITELKEEEFSKYDIMIVVAYGKIFLEGLMNAPKFGSINLHYSLLPKYRGACPVESVLLNDEEETGVTIQKMALKLDSGPIFTEKKIKIYPEEKAPELFERLIILGGDLLIKTLPKIIKNKIKPETQKESEATYCQKIKKEDGYVNLGYELPRVLYNKFRAYYTWPRIYFWENNKRVIITDASLENGKFVIKKIIPEGKKERLYSN